MASTNDTLPVISDVWFTNLASAVHADRELQVIGRYSNFWIDAVSPGNWRVVLNFRGSSLIPTPWKDLPSDHIAISASPSGWEQIFDPHPKPLLHNVLALGKNSPDVTLGGSDVELFRNLRVLARLVDLGKALHVQH